VIGVKSSYDLVGSVPLTASIDLSPPLGHIPAGREQAEVLPDRARGDLLSAYGIIAEI
jgi:hypothetical protein